MSSPPQKLSSREVELVLRRATEIDSGTREAAEALADDASLTVAEMMKLGDEAGLQRESIARALTEMRQGLMTPAEESGPISRTLGPGRIVVTRDVPGPPGPVRRAVDRFLRDQLMTIRRHHGDRVEWERAQGIWPGLVRSLDFSRRYAFGLVTHVETIVTSDDDQATSVTFHIDLSEMRRERLLRMGFRAAAAFALIGLGGAALFSGFGVNDLIALGTGGAAAGGVFALERRRFLESRNRVALAPERFLDLLVLRRKRSAPADEE